MSERTTVLSQSTKITGLLIHILQEGKMSFYLKKDLTLQIRHLYTYLAQVSVYVLKNSGQFMDCNVFFWSKSPILCNLLSWFPLEKLKVHSATPLYLCTMSVLYAYAYHSHHMRIQRRWRRWCTLSLLSALHSHYRNKCSASWASCSTARHWG